jgi:hypothetical protein
MTFTRNPGANPRPFVRSGRAIGAVMMAAMAGLPALFPVLADPPKPGVPFARKYTPVNGDTEGKINSPLMVRTASFQTLIENQSNGVIAGNPPGVIGGIHQGRKAVVVGAAAGQPVRLLCCTARRSARAHNRCNPYRTLAGQPRDPRCNIRLAGPPSC